MLNIEPFIGASCSIESSKSQREINVSSEYKNGSETKRVSTRETFHFDLTSNKEIE